jgi:hypothetical protein
MTDCKRRINDRDILSIGCIIYKVVEIKCAGIGVVGRSTLIMYAISILYKGMTSGDSFEKLRSAEYLSSCVVA